MYVCVQFLWAYWKIGSVQYRTPVYAVDFTKDKSTSKRFKDNIDHEGFAYVSSSVP